MIAERVTDKAHWSDPDPTRATSMLARLLGHAIKVSALYRKPTVRHNPMVCSRRLCSRASGTSALYPKAHQIQSMYLQAQAEGRQLTEDEALARDLWAAQNGFTTGGFESFKLGFMLDDTSGINTLLKAAYVGDVKKAKAAAQLLANNDDALRESMARTKVWIDSATTRDKELHKALVEAKTGAENMQLQRWFFWLFGPVETWALWQLLGWWPKK